MRTAQMFGPFAHANGYDRLTRHRLTRVRRRIVADVTAAALPAGARIMDAGTGPGRLPLAIAAALPHVTVDGVDLAPDMIERARANAAGVERVAFTVGDVARLPFPDGTFDLVVSSFSQHHWTDPEGAVRDLRRVLRPHGALWIYDARWTLRRASVAARATFDPATVRREPVRTGRLPIAWLARLSAEGRFSAEGLSSPG